MKKILKTIFKIFETIFFVLTFIYVSFLVLQKFNIYIGGYRAYTVVSGSMSGVYEVGDVILVKKVDKENLKVGDDVTYIQSGADRMIITHRITDITGDVITTKGVANQIADPAINYSQIIGKVVYRTNLISQISRILRTSYGFFFLVFVPIVIICTLEIIYVFNPSKEIDEDSKEL